MKKEDEILEKLDKCLKKLGKHDEMLEKHEKILEKHGEILERHDQKFDEIIEELRNISRSVCVIEDEIKNKIPALFDAYGFQQDHQKRSDQRIDFLEKKVEENSNRIILLEMASNNS